MFEKNIGTHLSLDETSISNGELYTILTNKAGKGGKGSLVALVEGTKAEDISSVFNKIPLHRRLQVEEVTLDFSSSMERAVVLSFPNARLTTDRFHVQQLVSEALQHMRIALRWKAIEEENDGVKHAKLTGERYILEVYANGDTKKQLLARSRYLLFKSSSKWTASQKQRAVVLFEAFPELQEAYKITMNFRGIYEISTTREEAERRLMGWFQKVDTLTFDGSSAIWLG